MAPSVALGHAFGRLGCLMTGCCYGRSCSQPWAINFPLDHPTKGLPVHPVQIYESALNFLFFGLLMLLYRRKKFDGQIFVVYLIGYAILRAFTESFRGDYTAVQTAGLSPGQSTGLIIFAIGAALWFWLSQRPQGKRAAAPVPPPAHG
jgi:phosphatidylglycerol:prolipoprotein diacylglycerol transferase